MLARHDYILTLAAVGEIVPKDLAEAGQWASLVGNGAEVGAVGHRKVGVAGEMLGVGVVGKGPKQVGLPGKSLGWVGMVGKCLWVGVSGECRLVGEA